MFGGRGRTIIRANGGKAGPNGSKGISSPGAKDAIAEGPWKCNCKPPLLARRWQCQNHGQNHGRWFYACQKKKEDKTKCNFFMWVEDAQKHEAAAPPDNSATVAPSAQAANAKKAENSNGWPMAPARPSTPPPASTHQGPKDGTIGKRKRSEDEEDASFPWPFTPDEEEQLKKAADSGKAPFATPSKAARTEISSISRKRRLPWQTPSEATGFPTPVTENRYKNALSAPSTDATMPEAAQKSKGQPECTPTPLRSRDVNLTEELDEDPLVKDVLTSLQTNHASLDSKSLEDIKEVLAKHSLKAKGVSKARDLCRLAIKSREAKISELEYRVATLQAELEEKNGIIEHMKWERENGQ